MIKKMTLSILAGSMLLATACDLDTITALNSAIKEALGRPDQISTKSIAKPGDFRGCWEATAKGPGGESKETNVFFKVSDNKFKFITKGDKNIQDMTIKDKNASFVGKDNDGNAVALNADFKFEDGKKFVFTNWTNSLTNEPLEGVSYTMERCGVPDISGCWVASYNGETAETTFEMLTDGVFSQTAKDSKGKAEATLVPGYAFVKYTNEDGEYSMGAMFEFKAEGAKKFVMSNPLNLDTLEKVDGMPGITYTPCDSKADSSASKS